MKNRATEVHTKPCKAQNDLHESASNKAHQDI
jgi:hypothetical protein